MIRAAITGLGVQGKKYAEIIYKGEIENMELVGVVARSEENSDWTEKNMPGVKIYKSCEELFNNSLDFDAVIITTPHRSHPEIAMAAFEKGKAVLCDKPSGISVKEVEKMNKMSEGIPFAMMFNNRVQPLYKWIKKTLENNEIGVVKRVLFESTKNFRTQHYHNSTGWRSTWEGEGGGALINQGQHLLDLWCWFFGMPEKVLANVCYGKYNDFDVDDEATLIMKYKDKSGVFIISTGEPMGQDKIEIVGTEGRIIAEGNNVKLWKYENSVDYIKSAHVNNGDNIRGSVEELYFAPEKKPYHIMLKNFADYVEGRAEPVAKGIEGIYPLKICKLAYR